MSSEVMTIRLCVCVFIKHGRSSSCWTAARSIRTDRDYESAAKINNGISQDVLNLVLVQFDGFVPLLLGEKQLLGLRGERSSAGSSGNLKSLKLFLYVR